MSGLVAEKLRQGPMNQGLPACLSGRSETPGRHRFADAEAGHQGQRRPALDGRIVADAAAPLFGGDLGHLGAKTLEHHRAHTDVPNFVFDHQRGRRKY
jgi:hypothetical protein